MKKRFAIAALIMGTAFAANAADQAYQTAFNDFLAQGYNYATAQQLAAHAMGTTNVTEQESMIGMIGQGMNYATAQQLTIGEVADAAFQERFNELSNQGFNYATAQQLATTRL